MTKVQRAAILDAHRRHLAGVGTGAVHANPRTERVLRREGWVAGLLDKPTRAGLLAAGVLDDAHAEALDENEARDIAVVGAIVQRRREVGPGFPIGRVTHVAEGTRGPMVAVSFNGLPGLWADPGVYVLAPQEARDAHSSAYWESATAGVERRPAFR